MSVPGGDHAIWIVAAVLYVLDAARLLAPREFLLVEGARGHLAPALADAPFTLGGRIVAFGPLLRPDRAVFVVRWGDGWSDPAALHAARRRLADVAAALLPLRVVVVWVAAWLFVAGPALTSWLGPTLAIYLAAAAVYPAALAAALLLWRARRRLGLGPARVAQLAVETLVCPPALANLVRKVTAAQRVDGDGAQIALADLDADGRARFWERLEGRAEELVNEVGRDEAEGRRLRAYLTTARAAR
jgi:hypothetical protein